MNHYNYLTDMMELPVIPLRGLVVFQIMCVLSLRVFKGAS